MLRWKVTFVKIVNVRATQAQNRRLEKTNNTPEPKLLNEIVEIATTRKKYEILLEMRSQLNSDIIIFNNFIDSLSVPSIPLCFFYTLHFASIAFYFCCCWPSSTSFMLATRNCSRVFYTHSHWGKNFLLFCGFCTLANLLLPCAWMWVERRSGVAMRQRDWSRILSFELCLMVRE